jgi:tyrosinase
MKADITIAHPDADGRNYLTWAPVRATIGLVDAGGADPVEVTLANDNAGQGGQLEFGLDRNQPLAPTLDLTLAADGTPTEFYVAGDFPQASTADGDAVLKAAAAGETLATKPVMVRIRKNAEALTDAERDRFTTALAKLNAHGAGLFKDFRAMHRESLALDQAHGAPGFLSWHRAYLLDLERELQIIDASVALPYWRFDQPAARLFTPEFLGQTNPFGTVILGPANLLQQWVVDSLPGISRRPQPGVDPVGVGGAVIDQAATLALGGPNAIYDIGPGLGGFERMERNPHGNAHTTWSGWIHDPDTAPRDPLFFLLHCNVDRLWATWQWLNDRFDGTQKETYFFRGTAADPNAELIGHNLGDTIWPWDNDTNFPRPANAPRTPFPVVPTAPAPGAMPTIGDMIDYQGLLQEDGDAGFGYDDVPFGRA